MSNGVVHITHSKTSSGYLQHRNLSLWGNYPNSQTVCSNMGGVVFLQLENNHVFCKGSIESAVCVYEVITSQYSQSQYFFLEGTPRTSWWNKSLLGARALMKTRPHILKRWRLKNHMGCYYADKMVSYLLTCAVNGDVVSTPARALCPVSYKQRNATVVGNEMTERDAIRQRCHGKRWSHSVFKQAGHANTDILVGFSFSPKRRSTKLALIARSQRGHKTAENTPTHQTDGLLSAAHKKHTHQLKCHQNVQ